MIPALTDPIADLLRDAPWRARVFDRYAIAYCCDSSLTLAEACRQRQLDPEAVLQALALDAPEADPFLPLGLGALSDEIVARHHESAREQGLRIQALLDKAARVHGGREPRLRAAWVLFQQLHAELLQHMLKEEGVLFPYCRRLELAVSPVAMHCGSVANPIRAMEFEHDRTKAQMDELRQLFDDFRLPAWACNTVRVLYHELQAYLADLETHMAVENQVLFPAALRREHELRHQPEDAA